MPRLHEHIHPDGVPLVRLESDSLKVEVAPGIGGRIVSLVEKRSGHEFLWRNKKLRLQALLAGTEYDPNFFGGIDELLPNDIPERIDTVDCPDHGELWTARLNWHAEGERLLLAGRLPKFGLSYQREMRLSLDSPRVELVYTLSNETSEPRHFLWKLHAALAIEPGDVIDCPARKARVVDLAWSRRKTLAPFDWPLIQGHAANVIPPADGTMDFFYLYELAAGRVVWQRPSRGLTFAYEFDTAVFPFVWLFASYGGFDSHYTVILEPCTAMPMSVNEAAAQNQCSVLRPGESLRTQVTIYAGPQEGLETKG
jgi:galactose mutarotase-like enzyme